MSLGLVGEYNSDDSSTGTPPPNNDTETPPPKIDTRTTSISVSECNSSPENKKSYFDENFSDDSTDASSDESCDNEELPEEVPSVVYPPLPLPDLQRLHSGKVEATPGSVFSIPYKEEEDAKLAVLKKHVTLAPTEEPAKEEKRHRRMRRKRYNKPLTEGGETGMFNDQDSSIRSKNINKVRTGLSQGLIPSQKYMKLHQKQQANERPWTLK